MDYYKTKLKDTWKCQTITTRLIFVDESYISSTEKIADIDYAEISEDEFNVQLNQFKTVIESVVEPVQPETPTEITNNELKEELGFVGDSLIDVYSKIDEIIAILTAGE